MIFERQFALSELDKLVSDIILKNLIPLGSVVILSGELGAGKTTFTRQFFRVFDVTDVTSPTYNIHNQYLGKLSDGAKIVLNHWDLYRCSTIPEELVEFGDISRNQYTFIEWGGKFISEITPQVVIIELQIIDQNHRKIIIKG